MSLRFPLTVVKSITNTRTSAGTDNYAFFLPTDLDSLVVKLYTGTFTGTSPTIDIWVQTSDDAGTTWYDVAHMTQLVAEVTKQNANWLSLPVVAHGTTTSVSGASTLAADKIATLPIMSKYMNIAVKIGGTQVVNAGVEIRVYANSQSRAA